jgi:hypothetical protein
MPDPVHGTFKRLEDLVVPESQNLVAIPRKHRRALLIVSNGLAMLPAVEFDNELGIMAGEIRNVSGDRNLPPKMPPFRFEHPKLPPQDTLCRGGVVTQYSCKSVRHAEPPTPTPPHKGEGN